MLERIKEDLIRFTGERDEIEALWDEAVEVAHALSRIVPDIGFLSNSKRLSAYLVTTGRMSELEVSPDTIEVATAILLQTNTGFRKGYQTFIHHAKSNRIGIGDLNPVAMKAIEGMRSVRGY